RWMVASQRMLRKLRRFDMDAPHVGATRYPNGAMRSLVAAAEAIDVSAYPDVHAYEDELDALLWVLKVTGDNDVATAVSAAQAAELLVEVYRRDMTRQRAAALLRGAKGLVAERKNGAESTYLLLKNGSDRVT